MGGLRGNQRGGFIKCLCATRTSTGVFVDPAFGPLVQPDVRAIIGIRLDKLKGAGLYKRYENQLNLDQLNEFAQRTGLDPRRDLWQVLVTWNGTMSLAMARGRFTVGELEPKLAALGGQRTSYKDYTIIGTGTNSAVFMNPTVAVAGSETALKHLIDSRDGGEGGLPEQLRTRLASLPKDDQVFVASRGGLPMMGVQLRSEVSSALSNIVGYVSETAIGLGVDQGLHLKAQFICVSEQGAQRVRDAIRGSIGFARLSTKDNQLDLLKLYDSVDVKQEGQTVRVGADLSGDLAGRLIENLSATKGLFGDK